MSDVALRIAALWGYPVKSCAGVAQDDWRLVKTGLEFDRHWMVVDTEGRFVTQRTLPRMSLIHPQLRSHGVELSAPGMPTLPVAFGAAESPTRVTIWKDDIAGHDMGDVAAQWVSDFLEQPLRLVRFESQQQRLSNRHWTGDIQAENAFSDGFPLLVTSVSGLDELNRRLVASGGEPVTMQRMRPNLVLDGLDAHGEDHLDEIQFDTPEGPVRIKLVKPCARCTIPDVDPLTAATGHAVADALAGYRADARLDGAITFGMNAVIVDGIERRLRVGMRGGASYRFD